MVERVRARTAGCGRVEPMLPKNYYVGRVGAPVDPRRPVDETVLKQLAAAVDKAKAKIDNARWTTVMGIIMMFVGQISVGIAVGGALMTIYGGGAWIYWAGRVRRLDDQEWEALGLPDPFDVLEAYDRGEVPEDHGGEWEPTRSGFGGSNDQSLAPPSRRR